MCMSVLWEVFECSRCLQYLGRPAEGGVSLEPELERFGGAMLMLIASLGASGWAAAAWNHRANFLAS